MISCINFSKSLSVNLVNSLFYAQNNFARRGFKPAFYFSIQFISIDHRKMKSIWTRYYWCLNKIMLTLVYRKNHAWNCWTICIYYDPITTPNHRHNTNNKQRPRWNISILNHYGTPPLTIPGCHLDCEIIYNIHHHLKFL